MSNTASEEEKLNLFKALTLVEISRQYLEFILQNQKIKHNARKFLVDEKRRLDMFIQDMNMKLGSGSRGIVNEYLKSDLLAYDAVLDKMALMTPEARNVVEQFCDELLKKLAA